MIIGLTGTIKAGKGNIVRALTERGFGHHSVRGFLLEEIAKMGLPPDRESMVAVANELRAKHGPNHIVEQLYFQGLATKKDFIVESIRNPGEIEFLREMGGQNFYLISVDAPIEKRFQRALVEAKGVDKKTLEEFKAAEEKEMRSDDPNKQQLGECISRADYHFWSDFEHSWEARGEFVHGKTGFLSLFGRFSDSGGARRPTLDEMFIRHAKEWASRSTCLRRHTGAVITRPKSKSPLTQGYNGPAEGVTHCADRGGCYRMREKVPSGQMLERCFAVHAEANALLKGAKEGIPLEGTVMYATTKPCTGCANAAIQSGVKEVIYTEGYSSDLTDTIAKEAGLKLTVYKHGVSPHAFPRFFG